MNCPPIEDLLAPSESAEGHLAGCAPCRRAVDELEQVGARLSPDAGEFDDPELAREVSTLIKLGRTSARPARPWKRYAPVLALAAAAALFFVVPRDTVDGFAARSGATSDSVDALDRWVSVGVFSARPGQTGYEKVQGDLRADDALVFAIENHQQSPYRYVMIFAFDQRGKTFWYHPAYLDAATNPRSIDAPHGLRPLDEAVQHDFAPGWIRVVALFSETPLDVKSVEAKLQGIDPLADQRLLFPKVGQHSFLLRVVAP